VPLILYGAKKMNMISTGAFLNEMDASNKQPTLAEKFVAVWEKKNAKAARAGGVSLMALSLAACGSSSSNTSSGGSDAGSTTTTTSKALAFVADTVDSLVGGAGDDTFTGDSAVTTGADSAVGGAGNDTLKLYGNVAEPTHSGIETIYLNGNTAGFDVSDDADVTKLHIDNAATGQTYTVTTGQSVTIENMAAGESVTVAGNTPTSLDVTLDGVASSGNDATLAIAGTSVATLNLDTASDSQITLTNAGAKITTVNLTGAGDLEFGNAVAKITTIDGSAATGDLTIDALPTNILTFTGGSGDDSIALGTTLASTDTIEGGAGTDTLKITATTATLGSTAGAIKATGFEVLEIAAEASGAIDFDVFSTPGAFDSVTITTPADGDDLTLTDFAGSSVTLKNSATTAGEDFGDLVIDPKDYSGTSDTINLTLAQQQTGGTNSTDTMTINSITLTGIENANITTSQKSTIGTAEDITVTTLTATSLKTATISGNADLTLPAFATTVTTVNGAAATGALSLTFAGANTTVTGGSANDTFAYGTSWTSNDTLDGGAGTDTMSLSGTGTSTTDVDATNIETVQVSSSKTAAAAQTYDLDGMASLTTINAIMLTTAADLVFEDAAASLTTLIIDDSGAGTATAAAVTVKLDSDTTADSLTIRMDQDGVGFVGDIVANDIETLVINMDYASAATVGSTDVDEFDTLEATDATHVTLATTNISSYNSAGNTFFDTFNFSANVTIDLTGYNMDLGGNDASITGNISVASADAAMSAKTAGDFDDGLSLTGADAVTIIINDDLSTANYNEIVIDLDAGETDHQAADGGGLSDTNIDTIKLIDDGTSTNDIGLIIIENFQDRTNYGASVADKIDLSGLGVAGLSELDFTDGDSSIDGAIISSKAASNGASDTDFDGMIILVGVDHTHLTADNFVFA